MLRFIEVAEAKTKYLDKVCVNMKLGGESNRSVRNILKGNAQILESFEKYNIKPRAGYTIRRWSQKIFQV